MYAATITSSELHYGTNQSKFSFVRDMTRKSPTGTVPLFGNFHNDSVVMSNSLPSSNPTPLNAFL